MTRRRTLCLMAIAAAGVGAFVVVRRRGATPAPPMSAPAASAPAAPAPPAPAPSLAWAAPVDGQTPDGYPVKVNTKSGIFHVPGGRSYDRTVPDRCYATAADAETDGYRRAKA